MASIFQVKLSEDIKSFIRNSTGNYGKAKLVLQKNKFFVESPFPEVLKILLKVPYYLLPSISPLFFPFCY